MKVLLINGSPKANGCTATALAEIAAALNACGIDTETVQVGAAPVGGCIGCGQCRASGKCFMDDVVNDIAAKMAQADGYVLGSPVHYAGISGNMKAALDRLSFSAGSTMKYKPGAVCVSARRAGTTAAIEQLTKYVQFFHGPLVNASYWPMVHGSTPDQVRQDEEGLAIMRELGTNMAWLLKCIELGKQNGVPVPQNPPRAFTNFIR